jgi:glycosyltransferase involved in cell wall biosynthesis
MEYKADRVPLLSIAIATRNRIPYAVSAIQSILEIQDPRLEIVVHDNSDSRDLEDYLAGSIKDNRLHYRYAPLPLSLIDNCNSVLDMATGEYLCLIGDDDGVNPEIIEAARWAMRNDLDSLALKITATYLWRGAGAPSTLFTKMTGDTLTIRHVSGRLKAANLERELLKLVRDGGSYHLDFNLPKVYHGFVHRRCLASWRIR